MEANGNIYLKQNKITLWLDGQKTIPPKTEKGNRAFTKTGLKVLFHLLTNETLLNLPYREIAKINIDDRNIILNNKKELLQKWMAAYEQRLKPQLIIGNFRFINNENFENWQKVKLLKGRTKWGGEPAGDILTNFLRPAELTLYTTETKTELMRNYRMIPDANGKIKIYQMFWEDKNDYNNTNTVPPLLIYTDLLNTGDRRCLETAKKIYDEYLQTQF